MPRSKESRAPEPIAEESSETYYKVRQILGEKQVRGGTQYLVDWEGEDPDSGKAYDPTWVSSNMVSCLPMRDDIDYALRFMMPLLIAE